MNVQPLSCSQIVRQLLQHHIKPIRREFSRGHVVHEPFDKAESIFLVESGEVRVFHIFADGSARMLDILGHDDWFGSAALAQLPSYGIRATATSPSAIWVIPSNVLLGELIHRGDLGVKIIEELARRLNHALVQASDLIYQDCRVRLINTLLRFSQSAAASESAEGVALRITHSQLAQAVGAARETISLYISELRQQNVLRTGRNRVFFNPTLLRQLGETPRALAGGSDVANNHPSPLVH